MAAERTKVKHSVGAQLETVAGVVFTKKPKEKKEKKARRVNSSSKKAPVSPPVVVAETAAKLRAIEVC
jgi:hypothetical protein